MAIEYSPAPARMKTAENTKSSVQLKKVTGGVPIKYPLKRSDTVLSGLASAKTTKTPLKSCWRTANG